MDGSLRFPAEFGDNLRSVELELAGAQPRPPRPVCGCLCVVVVVVRISVCLGRPGGAAGAAGGAVGGRLLGAQGEVPHQPEPAGDSPAPRLAAAHRPAGTRRRRSHGRRAGASTAPGYETPPDGRVLEVRRLGDVQRELVADVHVRGRLPEAGQRPQAAHHSGDGGLERRPGEERHEDTGVLVLSHFSAVGLVNVCFVVKMTDNGKANKSDLWASSDAIAIAIPPPSEDLRYLKSTALDVWLLGYEFPETIIVFMQKQIHFLCSQKKANLIGTLKDAASEAVRSDIVLHVKSKNGDGIDLMDEILHAVSAQSKSDTPVVGHIAKEARNWDAVLTCVHMRAWRFEQ
ncbi:FACT complex subunit SPT16 [Hordeum vulgare]|nr:FACT complex subunit SPT16 [Hordeum vulgare]